MTMPPPMPAPPTPTSPPAPVFAPPAPTAFSPPVPPAGFALPPELLPVPFVVELLLPPVPISPGAGSEKPHVAATTPPAQHRMGAKKRDHRCTDPPAVNMRASAGFLGST